MIPLAPPLLAFIAGILASPYLDARAAWICLPLAMLLGFARRPCFVIPVFLLGAGLRSIESASPAIAPRKRGQPHCRHTETAARLAGARCLFGSRTRFN